MEQQSDNNLDALFQKAAEEYPLKTNNKNWDIVAGKLHLSPTVIQTKKSKTWQYSVLLLLLLGGSFFIINDLNKKDLKISANQKSSISKKQDNNSQQKNKNIDRQSSVTTDKNNGLTPVTKIVKNYNGLQKTSVAFKNKTSLNVELTNKQINDFDQTQQGQQSKLTANNLNNKFSEPGIQKNNISLTDQSTSKQSGKSITSNNTITDNAANKHKSEHVSLQPQPKTFYGMLFFSPAFSTVKFQHINKPGYSIGIGLGYRINSRFSTELGLQRMYTNFYSDGRYFDTSNSKLKRHTKLDALNGNNKLTAIPIALRYNLFKNNYHFFATGGTNIALITHTEKYDYNVIKNNGSSKDVYRKFNALTGTKFFSSVNLSLGYETSVSKFFNVKLEPYFQVATKGLGVGNLPINNFGLNVGIIKDLK